MTWETLLTIAGLGLAALMVLRIAGNAVEWAVRVADAQDELLRPHAAKPAAQVAPDEDVLTAELMPQPPALLAAGDHATNGSLMGAHDAGDDQRAHQRA